MRTKNPPIDLSIVNRSTASTSWVTANGVISPDNLDQVKEQSTDNASALNSLPTPFARFFVAREAFRRVSEAKDSKNSKAGYAYEQLVSDCLDIYELLFNLKYHRNIWNGTEDIEIVEWNSEKELGNLANSMPKLYNALNEYYQTDIKEKFLYFVIYKDGQNVYLIGCSNPFTGWVTPPDIDKIKGTNNQPIFNQQYYEKIKISRKNCGGFYFDGTKLFEDRDEDFQNYMYKYLFSAGNIDDRLKYISSYIKSFQYDSKVNQSYEIILSDNVTDNNNPLIVNGIRMQQNNEVDINSFFQPYIIKVPYKINTNSFKGVEYEGAPPTNYDYLIPLNAKGLTLLHNGATCKCKVRRNDVEVTINVRGKKYTKIFEDNPVDKTKGIIKYIAEDNKYFNIGLFPNILSPIEKENNYFKVALYERDNNANYLTLNIDKCSLAFYKLVNGTFVKIEDVVKGGTANSGVFDPKVRSKQSGKNPAGSKYYEIYNTSFDAIEVTIEGVTGMIMPEWRQSQKTNESFTYAIDLGTSNTFISRVKNNDNNAPVQLQMNYIMTSFMHDYTKGSAYPESYYLENEIPTDVRECVITEFAPASIDGNKYSFPIRTAICHVKGSTDEAELFDNSNIAFFYEKNLNTQLQEILTDIKWADNKESLTVFIKELMLIIKADVLHNNGILGETKLIRFRPLSFDGKIKKINEDIWSKVPSEVFGVNPKSSECYTESEAPYYYFKKRDIIQNTDSVTVIDIGGGSTDIVYFQENNPVLASSVHFGCDELWGDGHVAFDNARENGIFEKYKTMLNFPKNKDVDEINSAMIVRPDVSAKNIINFWLSNQKYCKINDNLRDDFAPLFVYHFTALVYYIASLYKYKGIEPPRSIVFSGNGSLYIDNYITKDTSVLKEMITYVFNKVYGKQCKEINVTLPNERKESTCYGGLYKDNDAKIPEVVYHGNDKAYRNAKELINDSGLWNSIKDKYLQMNKIYVELIGLLRNRDVLDRSFNTKIFTDIIDDNYEDNFSAHFRTEITEKYTSDDDVCNDSIFFIPVIDKLFELTKVYEKTKGLE